MDQHHAEVLLQQALDQPSARFRDGQWQAIDDLVNAQTRLLVVQRTGWGKSSVYFISTRILRERGAGPTVIISPLLALMRNQLAAAERLGIKAVSLNSTNRDDWPAIISALKKDQVDAMLISPERLGNAEFEREVLGPLADHIGLLVVDEAHCISDWGHDFRPDYRRILGVLQRLPATTPVLATTATANDRVVEDVRQQLGNVKTLRGALARDSLHLQNLRLPDQAARLAWLAHHIPQLPGSGIVYVLTKRDADQVAQWLRRHNISAWAYYSNVSHPKIPDSDQYRQRLEDGLLANKVKVVVATSALGMGFDKPDLGFVLHYQAPGNLVSYYQQVGRAGRAIDTAHGVLLSGREDQEIHEYFWQAAFPEREQLQRLLQVLGDSNGLTVRELAARVDLRPTQIEQALNLLVLEEPAPVARDGKLWQRTPAAFDPDHDHLAFLTQRKAAEWREVQHYLDHDACLMDFLRQSLDDPRQEPCGRCGNCDPNAQLSADFPRALGVAAVNYLRLGEQPIEARKVLPAKALFRRYSFPTQLRKAGLSAETGRSLAFWNDAGWGRQIATDREQGHFSDELVSAVTAMIQERWRPTPMPVWVTCVPSKDRPQLVASFAQRLAEQLALPFVETVVAERSHPPQAEMHNNFYLCSNLDGVFRVPEPVVNEPVLLVDDVVQSRWTLTVVAALLRQAGAGAVMPVTLAQRGAGG